MAEANPTSTAPSGARDAADLTRYSITPVDPASFSTAAVCAIRHDLHRHPLLQLPALAELAEELTRTNQCRYIDPGTRQDSEFKHTSGDPTGRTVSEVFRDIERPGSWIALYNVETVPRYSRLLEGIIDRVRDLVEPTQPGIFNVGGFIFISAPPSVTPFHIDRENNFWLQIAGRKLMEVWDHTDRRVVSAEDRERFIVTRSLENVRLHEEARKLSHRFDVGPGDGVYFPSTSPHMTRSDPDWTRPGDGVSISVGVVFYTSVTRRQAYVHACNAVLRRLGMNPRDPGSGRASDRLKYLLGRAVVWYRTKFRDYSPVAGM